MSVQYGDRFAREPSFPIFLRSYDKRVSMLSRDEILAIGTNVRSTSTHITNNCEELNAQFADTLREQAPTADHVQLVHGSVSGVDGTAEHFFVEIHPDLVNSAPSDRPLIADCSFDQFHDENFFDGTVETTFGAWPSLDPVIVIDPSHEWYSCFSSNVPKTQ